VVEGQKKDGTVFPIRLAISELVVGEETFYCGLVEELEVLPRFALAMCALSTCTLTTPFSALPQRVGSIVSHYHRHQGNRPLREREDDGAVWLQEGSLLPLLGVVLSEHSLKHKTTHTRVLPSSPKSWDRTYPSSWTATMRTSTTPLCSVTFKAVVLRA
jgi:hypothetical protein